MVDGGGTVSVHSTREKRWSVAKPPDGVFAHWLWYGRRVSLHEQGVVSHNVATKAIVEMLNSCHREVLCA